MVPWISLVTINFRDSYRCDSWRDSWLEKKNRQIWILNRDNSLFQIFLTNTMSMSKMLLITTLVGTVTRTNLTLHWSRSKVYIFVMSFSHAFRRELFETFQTLPFSGEAIGNDSFIRNGETFIESIEVWALSWNIEMGFVRENLMN